MQDDIAIRIFEAAKAWMENANTSTTIYQFKKDILNLVSDRYGEANTHYINILKTSSYSNAIQKEIVLAELESIRHNRVS